MSNTTTFYITKESIQKILESIKEGKTQLPDFQRGWVWDDDHIISVLASISLSYPIGAIMLLVTGNNDVRFKPKLIEGVPDTVNREPDRLILDGQQRLTALYQSLFSSQPVSTQDRRRKQIKRWYYLDIAKALSVNYDREDAIRSIPEDHIVKDFRGTIIADYSTMEKECAAELLPLSIIYDPINLMNWQMQYFKVDETCLKERMDRWKNLLQKIISPMQFYDIPLIVLDKETPKEAICQVFEKVNTGGVPLTVFELLTAIYAAEEFNLRKDWEEIERSLKNIEVLTKIQNTDFLQAISLLATYEHKISSPDVGVSCKRKEILNLRLEDYKKWAKLAKSGFLRAAEFLYSQKIFSHRDLPYRTQVVPLATIFAMLGDKAETDGVKAMIARWYWCGVLGELYGSAIEGRFAKDLPEVINWINGGQEPSTIQDANFAPTRLYTLRTRNSAAYKGISALLMREGALDFRSGDTYDKQKYFDKQVDIHHIFPVDYCKRMKIDEKKFDCIINKTPLSAKTNRMIGGNAPDVYLDKIQKNAGITPNRMDEILSSHIIDYAALRKDDFEIYFSAREHAILSRIEKAMGKNILIANNQRAKDNDIEEIEDTT